MPELPTPDARKLHSNKVVVALYILTLFNACLIVIMIFTLCCCRYFLYLCVSEPIHYHKHEKDFINVNDIYSIYG